MADGNPFDFLSDLGDGIGSAIGGIGDALSSLLGGDPASASPADPSSNPVASPGAPGSTPGAQPVAASPQVAAMPQPGQPGNTGAQFNLPSYGDAESAARGQQGWLSSLLGANPNAEKVAGNFSAMTNKQLTANEASAVQLLGQMAKNDPKASPAQLLLDATQTPDGMALFEKGGLTPAAIKEVLTQFQNAPAFHPMGEVGVQTTGTGDATTNNVGGTTGLPMEARIKMGTTDDVIDPSTPEGQQAFNALGKTVPADAGPMTVQTVTIPGFGKTVLKMTPLSAIANPKQQRLQKLIDSTDKSRVELMAKTSNLLQLNRAGETVNTLLDGVNTPTGVASSLVRGGYGLRTQVGEMMDMYTKLGQAAPNMEVTNKAYSGTFDRFNTALAVKGQNAAKLDSALLNLGYIIARGNKGADSRVTEADVSNALDQIGDHGALTNGGEIRAAIGQTIQNANQGADDEWRTKTAGGNWDQGTQKPDMPTQFLTQNGHSMFIPDASGTIHNADGSINFSQMSPQTLLDFPHTPAAKTLDVNGRKAYMAAVQRLGTGQ